MTTATTNSSRGRSGPSPDEKLPAYRRIAEILGDAIRDGRLPVGALIKVSDAAVVFDSSRSPIKQAFQILLDGGLLHPHDGQGFVVGRTTAGSRITLTRAVLGLDETQTPLTSSAQDEMYFRLEHDLILHSIKGPLRLNELALARHFNIGRSTMRELIFRAQAVGIVERASGKSWRIVPFDMQRCRNLYDLRIILEPEALRQAAPRLPMDKLDDMLARLDAAIADPAALGVGQLDLLESDLHRDLLSHCTNVEIPEALIRTSPTYICGKHIQVVLSDSPTIETFLHDHHDILTNLRRGQGDMAADLLRGHLDRSRDQIIGKLQEFLRLPARPPSLPGFGSPEED